MRVHVTKFLAKFEFLAYSCVRQVGETQTGAVWVQEGRFMRWFNRQVTWLLACLALIGSGGAAFAQTATFDLNMTGSTGLTATVDGWTVSFATLPASCIFKQENPGTFTNTNLGTCSSVDMVETVYHNRLYLTFENATAGQPLETAVGSSATACSGGPCSNNYSDLNLSFTVTAPSGVTVSSARLSMTGSATYSGGGNDTSDLLYVSGGEASSAFSTGSIATNLSNNPNAVTAAFSAAVNSFSVSKDLKVTGNGPTPGATLALNTVMQMYAPAAPEPVSLSLLAVGVAGLGVAKLRRRRR